MTGARASARSVLLRTRTHNRLRTRVHAQARTLQLFGLVVSAAILGVLGTFAPVDNWTHLGGAVTGLVGPGPHGPDSSLVSAAEIPQVCGSIRTDGISVYSCCLYVAVSIFSGPGPLFPDSLLVSVVAIRLLYIWQCSWRQLYATAFITQQYSRSDSFA